METEVENCNCSLCPHDVSEPHAVHDFNMLVNDVKPFSSMKVVDYRLHGEHDPNDIYERGWRTNLRTKRDWEEREAIQRLRL